MAAQSTMQISALAPTSTAYARLQEVCAKGGNGLYLAVPDNGSLLHTRLQVLATCTDGSAVWLHDKRAGVKVNDDGSLGMFIEAVSGSTDGKTRYEQCSTVQWFERSDMGMLKAFSTLAEEVWAFNEVCIKVVKMPANVVNSMQTQLQRGGQRSGPRRDRSRSLRRKQRLQHLQAELSDLIKDEEPEVPEHVPSSSLSSSSSDDTWMPPSIAQNSDGYSKGKEEAQSALLEEMARLEKHRDALLKCLDYVAAKYPMVANEAVAQTGYFEALK